ncbi:MAG TPA: FtsX-like permease family protein [Bacteroidia bacterium]|jgi:ABC-type lipoprotein release transport system permease subunit|nr:FtsX-like permease family protein [Bacteroidia bacterium]
MYFKLAWRNIWRNRRRTLITASSVFFAVILAIFMRATVNGSFEKMTKDVVGISSGYIQVHRNGYWAERSIDNVFSGNDTLYSILQNEPGITAWTPRLESFSLASSGEHTKGVMIMGIDPERENNITKIGEKIIKGKYITADDDGIMLSEGLAAYLGLNVNDTVVLLGQGYHGTMAAGKYAVRALIHLGSTDLNKSMTWLPIKRAQELLGTGGQLTSISIMLRDQNELVEMKDLLMKKINDKYYEVMTWKEMIPDLDQLIEGDRGAHFITINILYLVITFGIFGTILMMMNERLHEFGIMIAIGMKKRLLALIVFMEIIFISAIGTLTGTVVALPLVFYFHTHPLHFSGNIAKAYESFGLEAVMPTSTAPENFTSQAYIVFSIAIILSIYPVVKIARLSVIKAINS